MPGSSRNMKAGMSQMAYFISSGVFGSTAFIAHSKYDAAFNKISMALLL